MDATLPTETEPDRWRRILAEKIETIVAMRDLLQSSAQADAFKHDVIGDFE
jgi:hypothetical protein